MPTPVPVEPVAGSRPAVRVLWLLLAVLALLRAVLAGGHGTWRWGIDLQRFLAPGPGWLLWALLAIGLVPGIGNAAARRWESVERWMTARPRTALLAAVAAGMLLVASLPDRAKFVGDYMLREGAIGGAWFSRVFVQSLPLDVLLHQVVPQALAGLLHLTPAGYDRTLGIVEAGLLALLAMSFARSLRREGALLSFVVVFFGGTLAMFTGYGRSAGEQVIVTLALGWLGLRVARDGSRATGFAVTLALALALHRSMLALLPFALLIGWRWARWPRRKPVVERVAMLLPLATLALLLPRLAHVIASFDLPRHVVAPGATAGAGLHALDVLNAVMILAPVFVPVLLAGAWVMRGSLRSVEGRGLFLLMLSFLPLLFVVQPQQGEFRDWDVFAPAGTAFAMWSAWLLGDILPHRARPNPVFAIAAAAVVPSLALLILHHDVDRSLERARAFVTESPRRADRDATLTWEYIGGRERTLGRWPEAAAAFRQEAGLTASRRSFLAWGIAALYAGDPAEARRAFDGWVAHDSADALGWLCLGRAAQEQGDTAAVRAATGRLRRFAGDPRALREMRQFLQLEPALQPRGAPPR